jgi:hypothetical protein
MDHEEAQLWRDAYHIAWIGASNRMLRWRIEYEDGTAVYSYGNNLIRALEDAPIYPERAYDSQVAHVAIVDETTSDRVPTHWQGDQRA